jgi:hypothetical protein
MPTTFAHNCSAQAGIFMKAQTCLGLERISRTESQERHPVLLWPFSIEVQILYGILKLTVLLRSRENQLGAKGRGGLIAGALRRASHLGYFTPLSRCFYPKFARAILGGPKECMRGIRSTPNKSLHWIAGKPRSQ